MHLACVFSFTEIPVQVLPNGYAIKSLEKLPAGCRTSVSGCAPLPSALKYWKITHYVSCGWECRGRLMYKIWHRFEQVCYLCDVRKGACIKCLDEDCDHHFHVTCALKRGLNVISNEEIKPRHKTKNKNHGEPPPVLQAYCVKHSVVSTFVSPACISTVLTMFS